MMNKLLLISHTLILSLGQPVRVPRNQSDIWISKKDLVEAQAVGNAVTLVPKATGSMFISGLALPESQGLAKVLVTTANNQHALLSCEKKLSKLFPHNLLEIESPAEGLSANLKQSLECGFDELVINEPLQNSLQKDFNQSEIKLSRAGLRIQKAWWEGGKRHVRSTSEISKTQRSALGLLKPFYVFEKVEGPKPGQTLLFDVSLFELSRSRAKALGLKLPQSVNFQLQPHDGQLSAAQSFLDLGFEFGENLGIGKILAKPRLRTKPGERALFQSGGEIPIRNISLHSSETSWKSYGLQLELLPSADVKAGDSEISVDFRIELSEPDISMAVDGVPGMLVRKLSSRFDLRADEDTLLSAMIQTRSGLARAQPVGLGDIPVVGRVFQDNRDMEQSSELWISIRPTWQDPQTAKPDMASRL